MPGVQRFVHSHEISRGAFRRGHQPVSSKQLDRHQSGLVGMGLTGVSAATAGVRFREAVRYVAARTVLVYDRMPFMFTPAQLQFLSRQVDETECVEGGLLEIGCAYGATTVYLRRHMEDRGITKPYTCVDTFSGFTPADIAAEQTRGKAHTYGDFAWNSKRRFERTLRRNSTDQVRVEQADISQFDVSAIAPLAFCLIDVDLYRPTAAALPAVWDALSPGGVVVVDDCGPDDDYFDGARAALNDFAALRGLSPCVEMTKLGVLRKEQLSAPSGNRA